MFVQWLLIRLLVTETLVGTDSMTMTTNLMGRQGLTKLKDGMICAQQIKSHEQQLAAWCQEQCSLVQQETVSGHEKED